MVYLGSVDDHFAKSLGSAWTHIKSSLTSQHGQDSSTADSSTSLKTITTQSEDMSSENSCMSVCEPPGSVDDHFAKALGAAWFRIKAQQEGLVAEQNQS